jgi:hypothetical protein
MLQVVPANERSDSTNDFLFAVVEFGVPAQSTVRICRYRSKKQVNNLEYPVRL